MNPSRDVILEHVLTLARELGGRRLPDGADRLLGAEHGVTGWDSIILLERLEDAYRIDLRPFANSRSTERKGWINTYCVPGDATARELADHVATVLADPLTERGRFVPGNSAQREPLSRVVWTVPWPLILALLILIGAAVLATWGAGG